MHARTRRTLFLTACAAALSNLAQAQTHPEKPTFEAEKCYGVAKAGQNDCFTANNSCGKTSITDRDPTAWKYVPVGDCTKMGGSLHSSEAMKNLPTKHMIRATKN